MTEKTGHYEKGAWIEDRALPVPQAEREAIEKRLSEATKAVITSIDNVMTVTRDLVTTDEGKQYIDKTLEDTRRKLQVSCEDVLSRVKTEIEKTKEELEKKLPN
jgi:hypothetical protein